MNKLKIVAASVGGVFVVAHIGLLGYVIHRPKQPQVPMINIPHGDYSSYSIRAGKDGYEIQYRANDPAILESHKSLDLQKSQSGFFGGKKYENRSEYRSCLLYTSPSPRD